MSELDLNLICLENLSPAISLAQGYRQCPKHIIRALIDQEQQYIPGARCISPIVTQEVFEVLGEWMLQVSVSRELEVFPCSINLATRLFARKQPTSKQEIQLYGAACLHLASKVQEAIPMTLEEAAYYTDDSYTCDEIKSAETNVMSAVNYDLICVAPGHFLDSFIAVLNLNISEKDRQSVKSETLRRINICLIMPEFTTCLPSIVASATLLATLSERDYDVSGELSRILSNLIGCHQNFLLSFATKTFAPWQKYAAQVYEISLPLETRWSAEVTDNDAKEIGMDEMEQENDLLMETSDYGQDEGISNDAIAHHENKSAGELFKYDDSDSGIQDDDESVRDYSAYEKMPSDFYDWEE